MHSIIINYSSSGLFCLILLALLSLTEGGDVVETSTVGIVDLGSAQAQFIIVPKYHFRSIQQRQREQ